MIDRLENTLDSAEGHLVWHKLCYSHFTDKSKIDRLRNTLLKQKASCSSDSKQEPSCSNDSKQEASCSSSGNKRTLRGHVEQVNWRLCIFCQKDALNVRLSSVMTPNMSDQIIQAAAFDYTVGLRLAGVIDLIAAEAKYHLACQSLLDHNNYSYYTHYIHNSHWNNNKHVLLITFTTL